jgi:hypothetical protein
LKRFTLREEKANETWFCQSHIKPVSVKGDLQSRINEDC